MFHPFRHLLFLCFLTLLAALASRPALAQSQPAVRIAQPIDDSRRVTLKGNVHPLAQARYDRGAVPDSFPADRLLLLLQRSPEQEAALHQFLQGAHTVGSANYHKWLTPEEFGRIYGPADSDVAAVTAWLRSQGFSVAHISKGLTAIEFSGSARQIRQAFNTEIHNYLINGEEHHANDSDPQIPAALASVVAGITQLNDFLPKSYSQILGRARYDSATHRWTPQWTFGTSPRFALAPGDFAVQYDLNPLYSAGTNGTGVTIGIIGASNVDPTVVANYRSLFGLPTNPINVVIDGQDPGQNGAAVESYLDVELSGAVAPKATINLYSSASTTLQAGLNLAALRAVDEDVASVLSTSYGDCEKNIGSAGNQFWAALWEQAAAQGQTSLVSSGDGGSAGCDDFNRNQPAQFGLAVNGFSSTPWNVSVGGTDFYYSTYNGTQTQQSAQLATYWNQSPTGLPSTSLLKPIPEQPWNLPFGLNLSSGGVYDSSNPTIAAGSGGASNCSSGVEAADGTFALCSGGYPKPSWQTGIGVPADGARDLPDVSLFAATDTNDSFYPVCSSSEECTPANGSVVFGGVGGTSASTPAMAGIMALINQKYGRQGQANFTLYPLAAQYPSVFHDITLGSNNVPCQQGTPSCTLSTLTDNTSGIYTLGHYYAAAGYDQATGLGSVDADLLVTHWNSITFKSSSTTLSVAQASFPHGTPVNVSVAVTGTDGTPTGDVALLTTANPSSNTPLSKLTLQNGAGLATVNSFPGGHNTVTARYAGDSLFGPSTSNPVTLDISPEDSTTSVSANYYDTTSNKFVPVTNGGSYAYGLFIAIDVQPHGVNAPPGALDGLPTGSVILTDAASTGTVGSGSVNINRQGFAEWYPSVGYPTGSHSVSASYSGDASFNPSASTSPLTFSITKVAPSAVGLQANPSPVALGVPTALAMRVAAPAGLPRPGGTVAFSFGNIVLGTSSLGPGSGYDYPWVGVATLNVSSLPLGTDSVTASYGGDNNLDPATASANVVVLQQPNLSATLSASAINQAQSVTVGATVPGVSGQPTPTGYVAMFGYSTHTTAGFCANGGLVNGITSCILEGDLLDPGNDSIVVEYLGDSVYAPTQVTLPLTITIPFTLGATPVVIAAPGATTGNTSTLTVSPVNAFTGPVFLSCALTSSPAGAVHLPGCSVPSTVSVTGARVTSAVISISSTAPTTTVSALVDPGSDRRPWLLTNAGVLLLWFIVYASAARRRNRLGLACLLFMVAALINLAACGGGAGTPPPVVIPGTTPGTYTFTVTGSFTATVGASQPQTVTVPVTIQ